MASGTLTADQATYSLTGIAAPVRADRKLNPQVGSFAVNTDLANLGNLRRVNVALQFPTAVTSTVLKFLPDLSAGDGIVFLEKVYTLTLTSPTPATLLFGYIYLPVKSVGSIPYRVQFPRDTGFNEHYIYLNAGSDAIDLSTLLTLSTMVAGTVDLTDLNDVTINTPVAGEYLRYNGTEWTDAVIQTTDLPVSTMFKTTYDTDVSGVVDAAEQVVVTVRNDELTTMTPGTLVYISGGLGNNVLAKRAQANSEATSSNTLGMVTESIAPSGLGKVALNGTVKNLDTDSYLPGDPLWLSATVAGEFTATRPIQPNHSVFVGWVARVNQNVGRIELHIQNGYEIDELHDVLITSKQNNDLLVYESATSLWKNKSASATGLALDNAVVKLTGDQTVAGDKTFTGVSKGNFQPSLTAHSGTYPYEIEPNYTTGGIIDIFVSENADILPPAGAYVDGAKMLLRITADGIYLLNWDGIYKAGLIPLPQTTQPTKTYYLGFLRKGLNAWDLLGYTSV